MVVSFDILNGPAFALRLDGLADDVLEKDLPAFQAKVALQVLEGVVLGTRVDTGRARGSWQLGHDKPVPKERGGTDPNGSRTILLGILEANKIEPFETTYVSAPIPYMGKLEELDGHVSATVARVRAQFA